MQAGAYHFNHPEHVISQCYSKQALNYRSTWQYGCGQRRSSIAAIACSAKRSEKQSLKYFSESPLLQPQSTSAVHYLAISPPRIRITDDQGLTSPEGCPPPPQSQETLRGKFSEISSSCEEEANEGDPIKSSARRLLKDRSVECGGEALGRRLSHTTSASNSTSSYRRSSTDTSASPSVSRSVWSSNRSRYMHKA
jgi:hypothetical protein